MNKAYEKMGSPWGSLGVPWGAQGNFIGFVKKWTSNSEQMCLKYCACACNIASRNSPSDPPDPADPLDPAEVASGLQLASLLPRAGGQDDVSLKETPSNKYITLNKTTG